MPSYGYKVLTPQGRERKGTIEAENKERAAAMLKTDGTILLSLSELSVWNRDLDISIFKQKVKPRDLSVFCRQFVSIIGAGVSIIRAMEMLTEQTENKRLKSAIHHVQVMVEQGESLSLAMKQEVDVFGDMFIHMVEAGESSGSLDVAFNRMAVQFEKDARMKATIQKAMIYPIIVAFVAVGVIVVMMVFVIPNFMGMFKDMDMNMPKLTLAVVAMSDFTLKYWWIILIAVVLLVIGIQQFNKTDTGKMLISRIQLKIPLVGQLFVRICASRFTRTLSTLFAAGVPMIQAIDISAKTMGNVLFRDNLLNAKEEVAQGVPLSQPIRDEGLFPPMVVHMLTIGEETGDLEGMLTKVADYYDEEVEAFTGKVTAAIEPLIIVLLAGIVGVLIMAVMSPLLALYSQMSTI